MVFLVEELMLIMWVLIFCSCGLCGSGMCGSAGEEYSLQEISGLGMSTKKKKKKKKNPFSFDYRSYLLEIVSYY